MGEVLLFSMTAAFNPTLLAAVTVLLLLDHPRALMLGYLLGAYTTSITLGLVIVFTLQSSSVVTTTKHTLSPLADLVLGALLLLVAYAVHSGRAARLRERRRARKRARPRDSGPPRWQRMLNQGSPRVTFAVGALLTLPGFSYLAALDNVDKLDAASAVTVLLVLLVNVIMLALIELPLLGYVIAPERTPETVTRFKGWLGRRGGVLAARGVAILGILLIVRGTVVLLAG